MLRWMGWVLTIVLAGCASSSPAPVSSPATVSSAGAGSYEIELSRRMLLDGRVSVLVPSSFEPMDETMRRLKYPSEQRPQIVFTDPEASVNVALIHSEARVREDQIPGLLKSLEGVFRALHPSAAWSAADLIELDGRSFARLDLVTPAIDAKVRNIMVATSLEGRMLAVTFNCTQELEARWAETARRIVESIQILEP